MKELSIEEKAERYDDAIERARNLLNNEETSAGVEIACENIFPEIIEFKDERIRKALMRFHKSTIEIDGIKGEDIIAWLEKQGEQQKGKSALEAAKEEKVDNQTCVKPTDKIEPKFKVGDWITNGLANPEQIISIEGDMYYAHSSIDNDIELGGDIESMDKEYHLWTIQDAKDGDVLISQYHKPFIYNGNYTSFCLGAYCGITTDNKFDVKGERWFWTDNKGIHPATKEQSNLLFQKMKEAGYEFDFEKKEFKKIKKKL